MRKCFADFTSSSPNTFTDIRQSVTARLGLWIDSYIDAATCESDFNFRDFRSTSTSLHLATGLAPRRSIDGAHPRYGEGCGVLR